MALINVMYQFDKRYAPYAGVSIKSLLTNSKTPKEVKFYLVTVGEIGDDTDKIKKTIEEYGADCLFIDAESINNRLFEMGIPSYRGSQATNFKLFIKELIPDDVERILYIDCDTIVCDDLTPLFKEEMKTPLAMCLESICSKVKVFKGFERDDYYFNGGVILFDMKMWKEEKCQERIESFMKEQKIRFSAPDQDLINVLFKGKITLLPPKYNLQPMHYAYSDSLYYNYYKPDGYYSKEEVVNARKEPVIMHTYRFIGEFPWHKGNVHPQTPFFDHYLMNSEWKDYEKKNSDMPLIFKIEKVMYRILPRSVFLRIFDFFFNMYQKKIIKSVRNGSDA